ncbi:MAG: hypothetical protein B6I31_04435 [Desulfobacteraceae bacterium 4572_19]|nr:MAG: hypothetical protein B6I31_04435 [Desulfobacteraceae bacterium 4572_19]
MGIKKVNLNGIAQKKKAPQHELNSRRVKIINDIPYFSEKVVELFPGKDAYPHYHFYAESYYILEGEMTLKYKMVDNVSYEEMFLTQGDLVTIEKNTIHHLINATATSCVFLSLCPQDVIEESRKESPSVSNFFICKACGYVYDSIFEKEYNALEEAVPFSDLNDDFRCPVCNVPKSMFECI